MEYYDSALSILGHSIIYFLTYEDRQEAGSIRKWEVSYGLERIQTSWKHWCRHCLILYGHSPIPIFSLLYNSPRYMHQVLTSVVTIAPLIPKTNYACIYVWLILRLREVLNASYGAIGSLDMLSSVFIMECLYIIYGYNVSWGWSSTILHWF